MKDLLPLIIPAQVSVLIPIVVWILSVRKATLTLRLILMGVLLAALQEILSWIFALLFHNNSIIVNYATLPTLFIFYLAYYLHEDFTPPVRRAIGITGVTGLLLLVISLLYYPQHSINEVCQVITSASLILLPIYYFIHKIFFSIDFEITHHPFFFVSSALFVYHMTQIGILASFNMLPQEDLKLLWSLKLISNILFYLTLAYSFYIFRRYKLSL